MEGPAQVVRYADLGKGAARVEPMASGHHLGSLGGVVVELPYVEELNDFG